MAKGKKEILYRLSETCAVRVYVRMCVVEVHALVHLNVQKRERRREKRDKRDEKDSEQSDRQTSLMCSSKIFM